MKDIILRILKEETESNRYMFFQNLKQMKRQCELLLEMDESEIESILENGHDWAQDHIAEAKNNMDQVFDFIMNEVDDEMEDEALAIGLKNPNLGLAMSVNEGENKLCARGKAAAKSKFKVYPSAYANGYAVQVCKGTKPGLDGKRRCSGSYCGGKK